MVIKKPLSVAIPTDKGFFYLVWLREDDLEGGSYAKCANYFSLGMVFFDNFFGDRKSQSGAATTSISRLVTFVESFPNIGKVIWWNSATGIADWEYLMFSFLVERKS